MYLVFLLNFLPGLRGQQPHISGSMPRDGAEDLLCNVFISAMLEFTQPWNGLDPKSVNDSSLCLYPTGHPEQRVPVYVTVNNRLRNLVIEPQELLAPNTAYIFELTAEVKDEKGQAFVPYRAHFVTGSRALPKRMTERREVLAYVPSRKPFQPRPLPPPAAYIAQQQASSQPAGSKSDPSGTRPVSTVEAATPALAQQSVSASPASPRAETTPPEPVRSKPAAAGSSASEGKQKTAQSPAPEKQDFSQLLPGISFSKRIFARGEKLAMQLTTPRSQSLKYIIKTREGQIMAKGAGSLAPGVHQREISLQDLRPGKYKITVKMGDHFESLVFMLRE